MKHIIAIALLAVGMQAQQPQICDGGCMIAQSTASSPNLYWRPTQSECEHGFGTWDADVGVCTINLLEVNIKFAEQISNLREQIRALQQQLEELKQEADEAVSGQKDQP